MEIIVNEWLPEYFKRSASRDEKEQLVSILNFLISKPDIRIVVKRPSPFLEKIYAYSKSLQGFTAEYQELKKFIQIILRDSNKCRFVTDNETNLNEEFVEFIHANGNYSSDLYLFEAGSTTELKIIITTDQKLIDYINNRENFNLITPSDFIRNIINNNVE